MANTEKYEHALETLQGALSQARLQSNFINVTSNKELVLARYHPAFQFDTIQQLSEDIFRSFLYFENNHHWSGLQRKALRLCENMPALRSALTTLLNPTLPLAERWNKSVRNLRGLGRALATAILIVSSPNEFGVWNNTSERALRQLKIWPDFPRGSYSGEKYEIVNRLLNRLATDLTIDLWTLDAIMWNVIPRDHNVGKVSGPEENPYGTNSHTKENDQVSNAVSIDTIANSLKTIKEYRDFYDPEGVGWEDYIYEIFHVLGFSTEKIDSRLFYLKDMGSMTPQILVLCNFPQEDKLAIAPGIRWDSYLRYAARYYEVKWGILTNGLQLQVFNYGNQSIDRHLHWSNLDETIRNQSLEGFYSLHKTLFSLRDQKIELEGQTTTPESLREYWEKRSAPKAMEMVDRIIQIVKSISDPIVHYKNSRISIGTAGKLFLWCNPRKSERMLVRLKADDDRDYVVELLSRRGIECKQGRWPSMARAYLVPTDLEQHKETIAEAIRIAENHSH